MVASVVERLKVRIDEDDPAFVLVELNRLALESTAEAVVGQLATFGDRLQAAVRAVGTDAESRLARHAVAAESKARAAIQHDAAETRAVAAELLGQVARANRDVNAAKWFGIAAGAAAVVVIVSFLAGYGIGSAQQQSSAVVPDNAAGPNGNAQERAGARLAELGQAQVLLDCSAAGWTRKDGFCYGTGKDGRTVGWKIR